MADTEQVQTQQVVTNFILVAARIQHLTAELEGLGSIDELPKLLQGLVESGDMRLSVFPLPFANVLSPQLLSLHASGMLYDAGFYKQETLSMLVEASTGSVAALWVPQSILELAPHLSPSQDAQVS